LWFPPFIELNLETYQKEKRQKRPKKKPQTQQYQIGYKALDFFSPLPCALSSFDIIFTVWIVISPATQ